MHPLPPARPDTLLRILATSDLGAALAPMPTSFGQSGTCAGIVELLERESENASLRSGWTLATSWSAARPTRCSVGVRGTR
jgi:hypothetical protein